MQQVPSLRKRLQSKTPLIGTFVKTPHPHIIEILSGTALDFIVLDAEHAPFDLTALDHCLMAARLTGMSALVRVPSHDTAMIGSVLDMGADGIIAPHITRAEDANSLVKASLYHSGERGISGSHRAAGYGRADLEAYASEADENTVIIAQLEDASALENIDAIAQVDRIDCFFIGRADLMVSLGEKDQHSEKVTQAVTELVSSVLAAKKNLGTFLGNPDQVEAHQDQGFTFFAIGTDQNLLKNAAITLVTKAKR